MSTPEFNACTEVFQRGVEAEFPEVAEIFAKGKFEGWGEAEILQRVIFALRDKPEANQRIEEIAYLAFAPLREDRPKPIGHDPLLEAAVKERLHFDGDVPEVRTGALRTGMRPAVPVDTKALDPVAVGMMLADASEAVTSEMKGIEAQRVREIEGATESLALTKEAALALMDRDTLPDPTGYERGRAPALHPVPVPEGSALASLSDDTRHRMAWASISTTQGRRSLLIGIREGVLEGMRSKGLDVSLGDPPDYVRIVAYAEWSVGLAGPESTNPDFNPGLIAAKVLTERLLEKVGGVHGPLILQMEPVNTVDIRKVGWGARLLQDLTDPRVRRLPVKDDP